MKHTLLWYITTPFRFLFLIPIYLYSYVISPLIPSHCIYHPTCSRYTIEAIKTHGIVRGTILGFFRIFRCHGMFTGGDDPVPETCSWEHIKAGYKEFRNRKE